MGLRDQFSDPLELSRQPLDIRLGYMESTAAAFQLSARTSFLNLGIKKLRRMKLEEEDSPVIQPDQAKELAPDLPRPITEPIKLSVLQDLIAENELQKELAMKIAHGPDGVLAAGSQFIAGMAAHAFDPFEATIGAIMAPAVGAVGGAMMAGKGIFRSKRMVEFGKALARNDKLTYRRLATEGLVGNAVIEPVIIAGTLEDHQDASIYNSFLSVVGGGLGFAAAVKGFSLAPEFISRFGPQLPENHLRAATAKVMAGKKVDAHKLTEMTVREVNDGAPRADMKVQGLRSRVNEGKTLDLNHTHESFDASPVLDKPAGLKVLRQRKWYVPTKKKGAKINVDSAINPGRNFGKGLTLTDNPITANGYASHSHKKGPGSVHEVDFNKVDFVTDMNTETIMPRTATRKRVVSELEKLGLTKSQVSSVVKNNPTWMEAWDRLLGLHHLGKLKGVADENLEKLNEIFSELVPGDALKYETDVTAGVKHNPQNNIYIKPRALKRFKAKNQEPFTRVDQYEADSSFNKNPSNTELKEIAEDYSNRETDRFYNQEAAEEFAQRDNSPIENTKEADLEATYQEDKKIIDRMAKEEILGADELRQKAALDELEAFNRKEIQIATDAYNCTLGS